MSIHFERWWFDDDDEKTIIIRYCFSSSVKYTRTRFMYQTLKLAMGEGATRKIKTINNIKSSIFFMCVFVCTRDIELDEFVFIFSWFAFAVTASLSLALDLIY